MIKTLPISNLIQYQKVNGSIYILGNGNAIKNCKESLNTPSLFEERLQYVHDMPIIEGYTRPINLLADEGKIYGYEMEYLHDYYDLKQLLSNPKLLSLDFESKKLILLKLLKCLKNIHEFYALGDINLSNIMVNQNNDAKFIDWENGSPHNPKYPLCCLYFVDTKLTNIQQDIIKLFYIAISLIYEYNFENYAMGKAFGASLMNLQNIPFDGATKEYITEIQHQYFIGSKKLDYFDEIIKGMKKPGIITRKKVIKTVKR